MGRVRLTSTSFADFKIECGDEKYDVHRLILATHSRYFKRLFESNSKESTERKITLHDDPPTAVKAMVQYFYSLDYALHRDELNVHVMLHVHSTIFNLADKYDIAPLKDLALEKFKAASTTDSNLVFSAVNDATEALSAATIETVPHVYHYVPPTDHRLRQLVVQQFRRDDRQLLHASEKGAFDRLVLKVPEFARDLTAALTGIKIKVAETVVASEESKEKKWDGARVLHWSHVQD